MRDATAKEMGLRFVMTDYTRSVAPETPTDSIVVDGDFRLPEEGWSSRPLGRQKHEGGESAVLVARIPSVHLGASGKAPEHRDDLLWVQFFGYTVKEARAEVVRWAQAKAWRVAWDDPSEPGIQVSTLLSEYEARMMFHEMPKAWRPRLVEPGCA